MLGRDSATAPAVCTREDWKTAKNTKPKKASRSLGRADIQQRGSKRANSEQKAARREVSLTKDWRGGRDEGCGFFVVTA